MRYQPNPLVVAIALCLLGGCADHQGERVPASPQPGQRVPASPQSGAGADVVSLLGTPLSRPVFAPARGAELAANLAAARRDYDSDPDNADYAIWLGRRTAYLWRYREAIAIYTEAIAKHPRDARLYRHRGHRYITVREFDKAIADLERAAALSAGTEDQVEPDGAPNRAGIPRSTLHTNIWYHLGLAYYLTARFDKAQVAYRNCLAAAKNDDMLVATTDWLYMTLRRLGRDVEARAVVAPITADMDLLENFAYHRRLRMYQGMLTAEALLAAPNDADGDNNDSDAGERALVLATQGYGVGNWFLYNGQRERARAIFEQVVAGDHWAAFGYIAAEAELARMRR